MSRFCCNRIANELFTGNVGELGQFLQAHFVGTGDRTASTTSQKMRLNQVNCWVFAHESVLCSD